MSNFRQTPLTCSGHTRPVVYLAFSDITQYGYYLISACKDGKPMLRQGETGDWIGTFEGHKGAVWGAALNREATRAATGAADFTAKIWDAVSGDELHTFSHKHIVKSVDFSRDSKLLLTASQEKKLKIFDLEKHEAEPKVFAGHKDTLKCAIFTKDAQQLISASDDKTVRVWDVNNESEIKQLEFANPPNGLELSRDGSVLVVTSGCVTSFWDTGSFEKIKEFEAPTQLYSASLHHQKDVFVCGGEDFKMYKYDYESGAEIESFKGHFGPVHCVRFSPDGELYASGSEDGTLRLWQTTVGKTYGLWKCVLADETSTPTTDTVPQSAPQQAVKAEA
ncbi:serine-threonine kinase receptor-associated protein [Octopus vulgaris]|uniref:Serine-threonine kinase receptor-associated protein n=2 Tax=Octopus TaxID=6643 RepID=A0AA36AKB8_OCTVU|nr:serine-threonine kinase receptor-associated protein [Octopus sinensis]CAI9717639.1 serine-threonine kinase receptor-associated protein [Octopus vulgaris]